MSLLGWIFKVRFFSLIFKVSFLGLIIKVCLLGWIFKVIVFGLVFKVSFFQSKLFWLKFWSEFFFKVSFSVEFWKWVFLQDFEIVFLGWILKICIDWTIKGNQINCEGKYDWTETLRLVENRGETIAKEKWETLKYWEETSISTRSWRRYVM